MPTNFNIQQHDYVEVFRDDSVNGVVQNTANVGGSLYHSVQDTRIGRGIENFHKRKNSGELLPYTYFLKIIRDIEVEGPSTLSAGHMSSSGDTIRYDWRWSNGGTRALPRRFDVRHKFKLNEAHEVMRDLGVNPWIYPTLAAAKIYGRGWDGLTFLAEFHQIVRMFRDIVPRFLRYYKDVMEIRKKPHLYLKLGYKSADEWLQARYGWRILIYDIKEVNELIDSIDKESRSRVKDRAGGSFTYTRDDSFVVGAGTFQRNFSDVTTYNLSVRGAIIADFMPSRIQLNPFVTAWEIVPYSFVIDWLFNVGAGLNALSFLALNNQYTAARSFVLTGERVVSCDTSFLGGGWENDGWSNWDQIRVTEKFEVTERRPTLVSPLPPLQLRLDWLKVTDLLALILQVIRKWQ